MTENYPRRKQLYRHKDMPEIFSFANEAEYLAKLKEGYVFNPADLKEDIPSEDVDKEEAAAENTPEPKPETGKNKDK